MWLNRDRGYEVNLHDTNDDPTLCHIKKFITSMILLDPSERENIAEIINKIEQTPYDVPNTSSGGNPKARKKEDRTTAREDVDETEGDITNIRHGLGANEFNAITRAEEAKGEGGALALEDGAKAREDDAITKLKMQIKEKLVHLQQKMVQKQQRMVQKQEKMMQ